MNLLRAISFSGHHNAIAIDVATQILGADYIERHFTLNRIFKGTDYAASTTPVGLRKLKRNIDATFEAISFRSKDNVDIAVAQRKELKYYG